MTILLFHRVTDDIPGRRPDRQYEPLPRHLPPAPRHFRVVPLAEIFDGFAVGNHSAAHRRHHLRRLLPRQPGRRPRAGRARPARHLLRAHRLRRHRPRLSVGPPPAAPCPTSTGTTVREMADLGFEIGSHTVNHLDLGVASRDERVRADRLQGGAGRAASACSPVRLPLRGHRTTSGPSTAALADGGRLRRLPVGPRRIRRPGLRRPPARRATRSHLLPGPAQPATAPSRLPRLVLRLQGEGRRRNRRSGAQAVRSGMFRGPAVGGIAGTAADALPSDSDSLRFFLTQPGARHRSTSACCPSAA